MTRATLFLKPKIDTIPSTSTKKVLTLSKCLRNHSSTSKWSLRVQVKISSVNCATRLIFNNICLTTHKTSHIMSKSHQKKSNYHVQRKLHIKPQTIFLLIVLTKQFLKTTGKMWSCFFKVLMRDKFVLNQFNLILKSQKPIEIRWLKLKQHTNSLKKME